ncbi:AAA family ATPase, partial [Candidatus Woesearchaeota archaeon]|nr:AAA family ATPase [Candidatus Woesearchaeota archaeon]
MKKEFKRIYILGCSGSGKTSVAQELARKLHIQHYDLDDLFWKKKYTI